MGVEFECIANEVKTKEKYKLPEIKKITATYISIRTLQAINQGTTLAAEMPTSGNLKSEESLFCITPPHPLNPLIKLGHYMNSYMKYRPP